MNSISKDMLVDQITSIIDQYIDYNEEEDVDSVVQLLNWMLMAIEHDQVNYLFSILQKGVIQETLNEQEKLSNLMFQKEQLDKLDPIVCLKNNFLFN